MVCLGTLFCSRSSFFYLLVIGTPLNNGIPAFMRVDRVIRSKQIGNSTLAGRAFLRFGIDAFVMIGKRLLYRYGTARRGDSLFS